MDNGAYTLKIILVNPQTVTFVAQTPNNTTPITVDGKTLTGELLGTIGTLHPPIGQTAAAGAPTSLLFSPLLVKEAMVFLYNNWVALVNTGVTRRIAEEMRGFSNEEYVDLAAEPFMGASTRSTRTIPGV